MKCHKLHVCVIATIFSDTRNKILTVNINKLIKKHEMHKRRYVVIKSRKITNKIRCHSLP